MNWYQQFALSCAVIAICMIVFLFGMCMIFKRQTLKGCGVVLAALALLMVSTDFLRNMKGYRNPLIMKTEK